MKDSAARKILYFSDVSLLVEILAMQRRITRSRDREVIRMLERTPVSHSKGRSMEQIDRYVDLGLRIGELRGGLNSCVTRSVIRCVLLRRSGVHARVAFGLNKRGDRLEGHCWVVLPGDSPHGQMAGQFHAVDIIPGGEHE